MWRWSKRPRRRPLSERVCYARLYGERSDAVELLGRETARVAAESVTDEREDRVQAAVASGPDSLEPAVHLIFPYRHGAASISGEDIRLDLLARMRARHGQERIDERGGRSAPSAQAED